MDFDLEDLSEIDPISFIFIKENQDLCFSIRIINFISNPKICSFQPMNPIRSLES